MALLPILRFPDPRLKKVAALVSRIDESTHKLVADMAEWRDLTAEWTAGPWQIERVSSSVAMHRTKAFAGYPL